MVRKRPPVRIRPRALQISLEIKIPQKSFKKAVEILKKGGVIIVPTDTVSGFVTPYWSFEGINRIYKIKRREKGKVLGLFISDNKDVKKFARNVTETRKRIFLNLWPGQLTLLFRAKNNIPDCLVHKGKKTVSLRIPSHPLILKLINEVGPLVQTSVNISGEKEITKYSEIFEKFGKYVDYVYPQDSYGNISSTILDVSKYPFKLIRKGPVGISHIENVLLKKIKLSKDIKTNILFLCTGNTCRSPMAMGIFYSLLDKELKELVNVKSAGLSTYDGLFISENTLKVLQKFYNVNLSYYRTKKLRREDLEWADFIYVMEKKHLREIQKMGYYEKVRLLYPGEEPYDIPDPFGKDFEFYVDVSKIIEESIKKILKEIKYKYS